MIVLNAVGARQGCTFGTLLYALVQHPILIEVAEQNEDLTIFVFADDANFLSECVVNNDTTTHTPAPATSCSACERALQNIYMYTATTFAANSTTRSPVPFLLESLKPRRVPRALPPTSPSARRNSRMGPQPQDSKSTHVEECSAKPPARRSLEILCSDVQRLSVIADHGQQVRDVLSLTC